MSTATFVELLQSALWRLETPEGTVRQFELGGAGPPVDRSAPTYFLTAWNPYGESTTAAHNERAFAILTSELRDRSTSRAQVISKDASWAMPALAVTGITNDQARAYAAQFMQPYVVGVGGSPGSAVMASGGLHASHWLSGATERTLSGWPCPLRDVDQWDGVRCEFGRVGSASAANGKVRWLQRRVVMLRTAPCDGCRGAPKLGRDGTIALVPLRGPELFDPVPGDGFYDTPEGWWRVRARIGAALPFAGEPAAATAAQLLQAPVAAAAWTVEEITDITVNCAPARVPLPRFGLARPTGEPALHLSGVIVLHVRSPHRGFIRKESLGAALPSGVGIEDLSEVRITAIPARK